MTRNSASSDLAVWLLTQWFIPVNNAGPKAVGKSTLAELACSGEKARMGRERAVLYEAAAIA